MNHFQFSNVFSNRRKALGVTQEQIADYVGVSRAAVSKWEKGQSYPDITLLPKLATYFNVSIDTLLGYEPQLTEERILALYAQLARRFAEEPYEEVAEHIEELLVEYYACFPFVLKMAQLYLNYYKQAPKLDTCMQRVEQLCERVMDSSEDYALRSEAQVIRAATYLLLGQPQEVLAQLGEHVRVQYGVDQLIANAHAMLGQMEKAKEIMQVSLYQNITSAIAIATESMMLHLDQPTYFDETVTRVSQLMKLFKLDEINANLALVFHLKAAIGYATQQRADEALQQITHYVEVATKFDLKELLKVDDYFYLLAGWIKKEMSLAIVVPRDEQSIKRDIVQSIADNPAFASLQQEPQFKAICLNLQHQLKEE